MSIINNRRRYKVDDYYFDCINTQTKAYFLGLMYADGCNRVELGHSFISLQENDKQILEIFRKEIKTDKELYFVQKHMIYKSYSLTICSKNISQKLNELGCVPRKSLILKFPTEDQVPKKFLKSFLLGYYDGDGGLTYGINNRGCLGAKFSITSTEDFCIGYADIIKKELNIHSTIYIPNKNRGIIKTTRALNIGGMDQIIRVLEWLYQDAKVYIKRKFDKFQNLKHELYERRSIKNKKLLTA